MPNWKPAHPPPPVPAAPPLLAEAMRSPAIPMAPANHADHHREWSRDGAEMTPELQQDTQPYLQAIMRMGSDFKVAHATSMSDKLQDSILKAYLSDHPLAKHATTKERMASEDGARRTLEAFEANLPNQAAVHNQSRELRNAFRHHSPESYDAAAQADFEQRYEQLCHQAGRHQSSLLERSLPKDSPLRTKLDPLTGGLRDPSTGLYANMVEIGDGTNPKNVLMFGGTGVGGATKAQIVTDAGQFVGGVPKAYQQAAELAGTIQRGNPDTRLETAGHSLGGGLAHYAALKNGGIKATCFNAAALGGGCKASIGEGLKEAKQTVRHINVEGDLVGDGIGQVRVPLQKAADGLQAAGRNLEDSLASAGHRTQQAAKWVTAPVRQGVGLAGQSLASATRRAAVPAVNSLRDAAGDADRASSAVKSSVRTMLSRSGEKLNPGVSSLKEGASAAGKRVERAAMKTAVGRKAESAKRAAVTLYENLGVSRGKLAIPHQYGGCISMENGGNAHPIANHLSGAIAKAYDRNERRNQSLRNQMPIGPRNPPGAGGGINV